MLFSISDAEARFLGVFLAAQDEPAAKAAIAAHPAAHASLVAKLKRLLGEAAPALPPDAPADADRRLRDTLDTLATGG